MGSLGAWQVVGAGARHQRAARPAARSSPTQAPPEVPGSRLGQTCGQRGSARWQGLLQASAASPGGGPPVSWWQLKRRLVLPQRQGRDAGSWQGGQAWSGGWQGRGQAWAQPGRRRWQRSAHGTQGSARGSWQRAAQPWLPQASCRPQGASQAKGAALPQGCCWVVCPPWQVTGTGTWVGVGVE